MRRVLLYLLIMVLAIPLSYQTDIYNCQTISTSGVYNLKSNIYDYTTTCFRINANDVILNCEGHVIDGNKGSGDYGIRINNYNNITIINCNVQQFDRGIYVNRGSDIHIDFSQVSDNKNYGIYAYRTNDIYIWNTTIENNKYGLYGNRNQYLELFSSIIKDNTQRNIYLRNVEDGELYNNTISGANYGIYLYTSNSLEIHHNIIELANNYGIYLSSAGNNEENHIYDNYFNNDNNFRFAGTKYYNRWYDEAHFGDGIKWNIIAGNFWANPSGTGFSQTCEDNDENGICDNEYQLTTDNIDVFPLSNYQPIIQDWWNDDWAYRQKIKIEGNIVDNYPIYLEVNTASMILAGKLRQDCGDLRFIDYTPFGFQELSYFIVNNTCNSINTRIYVKIPHKETEYIYMYYGNPTALSQSNGETTFLFFDDFAGNSLNTSKWSILNSNFTIENGEFVGYGQDETKFIISKYKAQEPFILEYYSKPSIDSTSVDWDAGIGFTFDGTNYLFFTDDPAGTGLAISGYAPTLWRSVDYIANRWINDVFHRYVIKMSSYTSIYYDKDDGRFNQDDVDRHTGGNITLVIDEDDPNEHNDFIVDVIMVYPYVEQEPNIFFYSEENKNDYPFIHLLSPQNQYVATEDNITFTAIATDRYSTNMWARLYIYDEGHDLYYRSDWITISNNTAFSFNYQLGVGKWYWNVEVDDLDTIAPKRAMAYEDNIIWKDGANPSITIILPQNTTYPTNTLNLSTNATDDLILRECKYSLNNQPNTTYNCFDDVIEAQEGQNCLKVWAIDLANNTAYDSKCFTTDTDAPYWANLSETPPQPIEDDNLNILNLSIEWYADIYPVDYVVLNFDGTNYTPNQTGNTYYYTFSGLTPKIYNYTWYAWDTAGRLNYTSRTYAVCDIGLNVNSAFNPIYHNTFQIIDVYAYYEATNQKMPNATITISIYDPDNNLIDEETKQTDSTGHAKFNIFLSNDLKTGFYLVEAVGTSPEGFTTDSPFTDTFQLVSVGLANPLIKINDGTGLYTSKISSDGNYTIKVEAINPSSSNTIERAIVKVLLPIDTNPQQYPEGDVIEVLDNDSNPLYFSSDFNEYNMPYIYFIIYNLTANERRTYYVKVKPRLCEYVDCQENDTLLQINAQYNTYIEDILKNLQLNITLNNNNILSRLDDLEAIIINHIDEALQNQTQNLTTQIYNAKIELNNSIQDTYLLINNDINRAILLINNNTNQSREQILQAISNLKVYLETSINQSRDLILYSLNNNHQELLYFLNSNFTSLNQNLTNYYQNLYDFINATNQTSYHLFTILKANQNQILATQEQILNNISNLNQSSYYYFNQVLDNQEQINETIQRLSDNIYQINLSLTSEHNQLNATLLYINNSIQTLQDQLALTNSTLYDLIIFKSSQLNDTLIYTHQDLSQLIQEHNDSISSLINNSKQELLEKLGVVEQNLNDSINYAVILINNNTNDKYVLLSNDIDSKLNNLSIELILHNDTIVNMLNNITLTINNSEYNIISTIDTKHQQINDTLNYLTESIKQNITEHIDLRYSSLLQILNTILDKLDNITIDISTISQQLAELNDNLYYNFTQLNNTLIYEFNTLNQNIANNFTYTDIYLSYINDNLNSNFTSINAYLNYLNQNIANNFTQTNLLISHLNDNIYYNFTQLNNNIEDKYNNIMIALQSINQTDQQDHQQILNSIENLNQSIQAKIEQLNQTEQQRVESILNEIEQLNATEQQRFLTILDSILSLNQTEQSRYLSILNRIDVLENNITAQLLLLNQTEQQEHQQILNNIAELQANITQQFINQNSLLESNFTLINQDIAQINNTLINLTYLLSLNFTYINETLLNINDTQNYNYLQLKAIIEATSNDIKNNLTQLLTTLNISIDNLLYAYFNCDTSYNNTICHKLENIKSRELNIKAIVSEIKDILTAEIKEAEAYGIITQEDENELKAYIYVKGKGEQTPDVKLYLPCQADKNDITLTDLSNQAVNYNIYKDLSGKYYIEFQPYLSNAYSTETYKLTMKKTYCGIPTEYNIKPIYLQIRENKGLLEYIRDLLIQLQEKYSYLKLFILNGGKI